MNVEARPYGTTAGGDKIDEYTLITGQGIVAKMISYGATLTWLETPDRHGDNANIVLAHAELQDYERSAHFFGTTVGRYANRIARGVFAIDDTSYTLARNDAPNHLHGGVAGFDKRVWRAAAFETGDSAGVTFAYTSPDGEEGYPGALETEVTYRLAVDGRLHVTYSAVTDVATHVNLTNHSYFNLAGHSSSDVLAQELELDCGGFLPVDEGLIPTGEMASVTGTPMDFRRSKPLGRDIAGRGNGYGDLYDVCLVVDPTDSTLRPMARAFDPTSGRHLEILGTQPGIQLYTGNHFRDVQGVDGAVYQKHQGFALETQHFPDSPNQPAFPSTLLRPGEHYFEETVYEFWAR